MPYAGEEVQGGDHSLIVVNKEVSNDFKAEKRGVPDTSCQG
jgi:hypothetical protein